jgi:predicted acyltransferase
MLALGHAWGLWLPIVKDLWTGSYVLVSAGWAGLALALCHRLSSFPKASWLVLPLQVMGRTALFFFVASGIGARILLAVPVDAGGRTVSLWSWLYDALFVSWLGRNECSSCAFAATFLVAWWPIVYFINRRGWRLSA